MEMIKNYLKARKDVFKHVSMNEDSRYAIRPMLDCYWYRHNGNVYFSSNKDPVDFHEDVMFGTFTGELYTTVVVNPTINDELLYLFDNKKKVNK